MSESSSEDRRGTRAATERVVNEVAQGLRTLEDGTSWFSLLSPVERRAVLEEVAGYAMQAHITAADGSAGVARSGVKPTANASVMIRMDPPRYGFATLPAEEHINAFRVLVAAFSVADTRRRQTHCKGGCGHSWHNLPTQGDRQEVDPGLSRPHQGRDRRPGDVGRLPEPRPRPLRPLPGLRVVP
ncbi:DUF5958 family protein [Kitasatospora sp. NPDC089913]|uniref:DUF5958 family protein n=1 Tax=Kitasatospora sp. NPDC089913 TaxID=3364080 RepID=UPI0037F4BAAE